MFDTIIIGGGASGITAAITAAKHGCDVCIVQRMERIGKKILATGNGRCNLMNKEYYESYPNGNDFAQTVLSIMNTEKQTEFWYDVGLYVVQQNQSRFYPITRQASTVLDVLRNELNRLNITVRCSEQVISIKEKPGSGYEVLTDIGHYTGKSIVLANGGCTQPKLGSNGSGYGLASSLGHTITDIQPSLTQVICDKTLIKRLEGSRVKATIRMLNNKKEVYKEAGEVLFTDYGISGICIMNASSFYVKNKSEIEIDFIDSINHMTKSELLEQLERRKEKYYNEPVISLLLGIIPQKIAENLMDRCHIDWKTEKAGNLNKQRIQRLTNFLTKATYPVKDLKGFQSAQVTRGGIACTEINPNTMMSKIRKGLYLTGEVIDVNGLCGGYNLMFAFATGIVAGEDIGGKYGDK